MKTSIAPGHQRTWRRIEKEMAIGEEAIASRDRLMVTLRKYGHTVGEIAELTGVSPQRVSQIVTQNG